MRVLLGVNTLTSVSNQVYANHMNLMYRVGRDFPHDVEFILMNGYRASIDRFRNACAQAAMMHECKYLMFLDDDVMVPRETFQSLLNSCEMGLGDIIAPVVYVRGYPFHPMIFEALPVDKAVGLRHYDDFYLGMDEHGFVKCAAVGFSCVIIRTEILRELPPPFFMTGPNHTEDVYFCCRVLENFGTKYEIKVDAKIKAAHLLDCEFIHSDTIDALKYYYETCDPTLKERFSDDRGQAYFEKVVKQFAAEFGR